MGERQKGKGASADHSRTTNSSGENDNQQLIKKIMETTRCTSAQAEVALFDNENDVGRAVEYILDRNGEVECWTESKSRKAKKEEVEKIAAASARRGGRGAVSSATRAFPTQKKPVFVESRPPRGTFTSRGGSSRGRGAGRTSDTSRPTAQHQETVPAEDFNEWKTGPLVFEPSSAQRASTSAAAQAAPSSASSSAPKSWAEMAKKATEPPPPPPKPVYVEPEPEVEEQEPEPLREPSPAPPSPEPEAPAISSTLTNQEWTRDLKANLGIGDTSSSTIETAVEEDVPLHEENIPRERVEFIQSAQAAPLAEYHFGFSAPEVDPNPPPPPRVHEVPAPMYRAPHPVQASPPQEEESVQKPSPPFSRGLSYENNSSVSYAPDMRARMQHTQHAGQSSLPSQPLQQQQQQQQAPQPQQQQHSGGSGGAAPPSMFPPHIQPPYHTFPYMGMYNGMGGVRQDEQLAAFMYPYMGQIDLTNILQQNMPAHHSVPPRTEHSDMNKYGGVRDNVAPPPGFGANTPFMTAQPSLSNLLVQPQYASQYSMLMNPRGYDEDRSRGVGKDQRGGGGHHVSHNTPPPSHIPAYGHPSAQQYMKKPQYPATWNSNN